MDWIKTLVLATVRIPRDELERDLPLKRNYAAMIQAVLESIQAAKEWIVKAQYDTGEDDEGLEIPSSVHTDLQLLEMVMQAVQY